MNKPKNWNEMDREQQRVWTQQETAREDAEYTAEQNQRQAESARRASMAARSEYEENEEASRRAIDALDMLAKAIKEAEDNPA